MNSAIAARSLPDEHYVIRVDGRVNCTRSADRGRGRADRQSPCTAIVLEVPSELIGKGKINAWATISLFGHAPEVQVSRWGLPMGTHLFLNDPSDQEVKEQFNASIPSEDLKRLAKS